MDVNITKRIDTPDGGRFSKVIFTPNGSIKPDWFEVDEGQEKHPEGAYYLDWAEDGQRGPAAPSFEMQHEFSVDILRGDPPEESRLALKTAVPKYKDNPIRSLQPFRLEHKRVTSPISA